jgi:SNF2 family DNA or RNA helicase
MEELDLHNSNPARKGPELKYVSYYGDTSVKNREQAIEDFNNDKDVKIFIGNPMSSGAGLNLLGYNPENPEDIGETHFAVTENGVEEINHSFCGRAIYLSRSWSFRDRSQSEARCHRRGTKIQVEYIDLIVEDTIDTKVLDALNGKKEGSELLQDVRSILSALKTQKR